jgi:two-component system, OmpR family, response regulator
MHPKPLNRILYVDDDVEMLELMRWSLLPDPGLTLITCNSGYEALANLGAAQPDLVLLDLLMPELDGLQTFDRLRAEPAGKSLPVMFLTGFASSDQVERCRSRGAAAVLTKPASPAKLFGLIRSSWRQLHAEAA